MRRLASFLAVLLLMAPPALAAPLPARIAAIAANPARAADQRLDARRHGPELMAFARVRRGQSPGLGPLKVSNKTPGSPPSRG
jgi:predicted methyltransferase